MIDRLFASTTIPLLEQAVNFTQARHEVLAGNIANLDTPGYRTRDLSVDAFQDRLRDAIAQRHSAGGVPSWSAGHGAQGFGDARRGGGDLADLLYHDQSNVGLEQQVTAVVQNQSRHNMALALLVKQFDTLQSAISERV